MARRAGTREAAAVGRLLVGAALGGVLVAWSAAPATGAGQAARAPSAAASRTGLADLSRDLQLLAERVRPALVQVLTTGYSPGGEALLERERGGGSGVVLDPAGYVLTNAHVVHGARRVRVVLGADREPGGSILPAAGRTLGAQVVGLDRETDLAVLKVEAADLPSLGFGDSDDLRQGQLVMAFGSPFGLDDTVTVGVVSAVARQLRPEDPMIYVQTDAPINPGSSGGPLVDTSGRVVGINTLIYSRSGGHEGIGFAAPSNIARNVFEQIRRTGRVRRGEIGARTQTLTPTLASGLGLSRDRGVIVSDVLPGGPAAAAGLQTGDVVLSLDGKTMENARQLQVNLYPRPVGSAVVLGVLRGERRLDLRVEVLERPEDPDRFAQLVSPQRNLVARLGVLALDLDETVARLLPPLRAQAGAVVAAASPEGPVWPDPLQPGDVIYTVNGRSVLGVDALRAALEPLAPGAAVVLQVERGGQLRFVALELE
jgi:serine protease Do